MVDRLNRKLRFLIFLIACLVIVGCAGRGCVDKEPVDYVGVALGSMSVRGVKLPWRVYQGERFYMVIDGKGVEDARDMKMRDAYEKKFDEGGEVKHVFCEGTHDNGVAGCLVKVRKVVGMKILRIEGDRGIQVARFEGAQLYCWRNVDKDAGLTIRRGGTWEYRVWKVDHLPEVLVFGDDARVHRPYGMTWRKEGWEERKNYRELKRRLGKVKSVVGFADENVVAGRYQGVTSRGQLMWGKLSPKHQLETIEWAGYRGGGETFILGRIFKPVDNVNSSGGEN